MCYIKCKDKTYREIGSEWNIWIKLLVEYGNSNRLRKLSLFVDSTESLQRLCNKFTLLTDFYVGPYPQFGSYRTFPLASLKHLSIQRQEANYNYWIPTKHWKHSLIGLELDQPRYKEFELNLYFFKLKALRRLLVTAPTKEDLEFVIQNVNTKLEFLYLRNICFDVFPDLSRLEYLKGLTFHCKELAWSKSLLNQKPMPSVLSLMFRSLEMPSQEEYLLSSKLQFVFPNLELAGVRELNVITGETLVWPCKHFSRNQAN